MAVPEAPVQTVEEFEAMAVPEAPWVHVVADGTTHVVHEAGDEEAPRFGLEDIASEEAVEEKSEGENAVEGEAEEAQEADEAQDVGFWGLWSVSTWMWWNWDEAQGLWWNWNGTWWNETGTGRWVCHSRSGLAAESDLEAFDDEQEA